MQVERIWLLMARKLSNEASSEELRELEYLLRQDSDNHFSMEVFERFWEKNEKNVLDNDEMAYEQHLQRMAQKGIHLGQTSDEIYYTSDHKRNYFNWMIAACIVGILAFTSWWIFGNDGSQTVTQDLSMNEITTPLGSKSQLRLPDSTVVWLNAGSKLTYPKEFGKNIREVTLVGEAYFEVKKKGNIPFVIHTHRMDIKVLGTTFNVKSYPGEATTEASLIKGSIEVSLKDRSASPILLKPKEKIIVREFAKASVVSNEEKSKDISVKEQQPEVAIQSVAYDQNFDTVLEAAWVDNLLVFTEMKFSEVVKLMERWYGITIQVENASLLNQQLTGSFRNETIYQALDALQYVVDFDYERVTAKSIIIK